jgi:DNA-binding transcriptional regulator/RsmH inhibitor MraZ
VDADGQIEAPAGQAPKGMYDGRLDDKGRLRLPGVLQKYFESLPEKKLFVTSLDRRTAAIYPIAVWRATEEFFDNYHEDPDAAETVFFNANQLGQEVEMDGQGRILFNTELRRVVKLENTELHFYAYRGHIEVLPDDMFKEREQNATVKAVSAVGILKKAGLR